MASRKGAARGAAKSRGRAAPKKKTRQSDTQALGTDQVVEPVTEKADSAEEPADSGDADEASESEAPESIAAPDSDRTSAEAGSDDALPLDAAFDAGDDEEPAVASGTLGLAGDAESDDAEHASSAVEAASSEADGSEADDDGSEADDGAGAEDDGGSAEDHGANDEVTPITDERIEDTAGFLKGLIEALLFVSDRPLELKDVARAAKIDRGRTAELLEELKGDYRGRGIRLEEVAGGFSFRSSPTFATQVRDYLSLRPVRLSRAQLETLAIVAYRQPITRPEIDDIRGVDSGPVLKGLLERDLIRIIGKKDEPGRPMLYGTTPSFLEVFSLTSLRDLPTLREYTELSDESRQTFETEIGEPAPEGQMLEELSAVAEASPGVEVVDDPDEARSDASTPAPDSETSDARELEVSAEATDPDAAESTPDESREGAEESDDADDSDEGDDDSDDDDEDDSDDDDDDDSDDDDDDSDDDDDDSDDDDATDKDEK